MYSAPITADRSGMQLGDVTLMSTSQLPDGVVLRDATHADTASLESVIRLAGPDDPDHSWRVLPSVIDQSLAPQPLA